MAIKVRHQVGRPRDLLLGEARPAPAQHEGDAERERAKTAQRDAEEALARLNSHVATKNERFVADVAERDEEILRLKRGLDMVVASRDAAQERAEKVSARAALARAALAHYRSEAAEAKQTVVEVTEAHNKDVDRHLAVMQEQEDQVEAQACTITRLKFAVAAALLAGGAVTQVLHMVLQ
jgi:chromosome segregation ATPase